MTDSWGGARPGSGRKPLEPSPGDTRKGLHVTTALQIGPGADCPFTLEELREAHELRRPFGDESYWCRLHFDQGFSVEEARVRSLMMQAKVSREWVEELDARARVAA